jgi:hypothetical protein
VSLVTGDNSDLTSKEAHLSVPQRQRRGAGTTAAARDGCRCSRPLFTSSPGTGWVYVAITPTQTTVSNPPQQLSKNLQSAQPKVDSMITGEALPEFPPVQVGLRPNAEMQNLVAMHGHGHFFG